MALYLLVLIEIAFVLIVIPFLVRELVSMGVFVWVVLMIFALWDLLCFCYVL